MNSKVPRLFDLLKSKNISQKELSEQIGAAQASITDWKTGKSSPSSKYLTKIASILGTTPAYLLGESDEKSAAPDDEASKTAQEIYLKMQTDPDFKKLVETARSLDPEKRVELVKYMDYLQSQLDRKDKQ